MRGLSEMAEGAQRLFPLSGKGNEAEVPPGEPRLGDGGSSTEESARDSIRQGVTPELLTREIYKRYRHAKEFAAERGMSNGQLWEMMSGRTSISSHVAEQVLRWTKTSPLPDLPTPTGKQFQDAVNRVGLSKREAAALFHIGERTYDKWRKDRNAIPPWAAQLVHELNSIQLELQNPAENEEITPKVLLSEVGKRYLNKRASLADLGISESSFYKMVGGQTPIPESVAEVVRDWRAHNPLPDLEPARPEQLLNLLHRLGWNYETAAPYFGIKSKSRSVVGRWVRGEAPISPYRTQLINELAQVPVETVESDRSSTVRRALQGLISKYESSPSEIAGVLEVNEGDLRAALANETPMPTLSEPALNELEQKLKQFWQRRQLLGIFLDQKGWYLERTASVLGVDTASLMKWIFGEASIPADKARMLGDYNRTGELSTSVKGKWSRKKAEWTNEHEETLNRIHAEMEARKIKLTALAKRMNVGVTPVSLLNSYRPIARETLRDIQEGLDRIKDMPIEERYDPTADRALILQLAEESGRDLKDIHNASKIAFSLLGSFLLDDAWVSEKTARTIIESFNKPVDTSSA
jgi:transcriptional regulator with XRE-family HTH domain